MHQSAISRYISAQNQRYTQLFHDIDMFLQHVQQCDSRNLSMDLKIRRHCLYRDYLKLAQLWVHYIRHEDSDCQVTLSKIQNELIATVFFPQNVPPNRFNPNPQPNLTTKQKQTLIEVGYLALTYGYYLSDDDENARNSVLKLRDLGVSDYQEDILLISGILDLQDPSSLTRSKDAQIRSLAINSLAWAQDNPDLLWDALCVNPANLRAALNCFKSPAFTESDKADTFNRAMPHIEWEDVKRHIRDQFAKEVLAPRYSFAIYERNDQIADHYANKMRQIGFKCCNDELSDYLLALLWRVLGEDRNRIAWYYILVAPDRLGAFKQDLPNPIIHLTHYGHILKRGFGQDPGKEEVSQQVSYAFLQLLSSSTSTLNTRSFTSRIAIAQKQASSIESTLSVSNSTLSVSLNLPPKYKKMTFPGGDTYEYFEGETYKGEFLNDKPHGKGTLWRAKSVIEGDWDNGKLVYGTATTTNGTVYRGQFFEQKPHGEGEIRWINGNIDEVECRNGKIIRGTRTFPDGKIMDIGTALEVMKKREEEPRIAQEAEARRIAQEAEEDRIEAGRKRREAEEHSKIWDQEWAEKKEKKLAEERYEETQNEYTRYSGESQSERIYLWKRFDKARKGANIGFFETLFGPSEPAGVKEHPECCIQ